MDLLKEVLLTAEEIYYIGKKINGRFLDYDYIASMADFGRIRNMKMEEIVDSLVRKRYAEEDLFGNVDIDPQVLDFIYPVYNSIFESELSVIEGAEPKIRYKFHIMDDQSVAVCGTGHEYRICRSDSRSRLELLRALTGIQQDAGEAPSEITMDQAENILITKGMLIGTEAAVYLYGIANEAFYAPDKVQTDENNMVRMHRISGNVFEKQVMQVLNGG